MERMRRIWRRLLTDDNGQDLMEYGLLAMLIAIVGMVAVNALGTTLNTVYWQFIAQSL